MARIRTIAILEHALGTGCVHCIRAASASVGSSERPHWLRVRVAAPFGGSSDGRLIAGGRISLADVVCGRIGIIVVCALRA